MKILNEAARLFFATTALILVGLLSAPMSGDLTMAPVKNAKVTETKAKAKARTEKLAQDQKRIKLRRS